MFRKARRRSLHREGGEAFREVARSGVLPFTPALDCGVDIVPAGLLTQAQGTASIGISVRQARNIGTSYKYAYARRPPLGRSPLEINMQHYGT